MTKTGAGGRGAMEVRESEMHQVASDTEAAGDATSMLVSESLPIPSQTMMKACDQEDGKQFYGIITTK